VLLPLRGLRQSALKKFIFHPTSLTLDHNSQPSILLRSGLPSEKCIKKIYSPPIIINSDIKFTTFDLASLRTGLRKNALRK
jgi:hypothetical protein